MAESKAFITWFLSNLPDFLMDEPMCYFLGFAFLAVTISLFKRIVNISS